MVERMCTDEAIDEAVETPPQTTRARLRGEFIRRAKERKRDYTVDWVHLKLNDQAQRTVLCKDPFKAHDERVERLIASPLTAAAARCRRSASDRSARPDRACSRERADALSATSARPSRPGLRAHRAGRPGRGRRRVVLNTTAVELGLGTGGWHVVHWNLARDAWSRARARAHHEAALHEPAGRHRRGRGGPSRPAGRRSTAPGRGVQAPQPGRPSSPRPCCAPAPRRPASPT